MSQPITEIIANLMTQNLGVRESLPVVIASVLAAAGGAGIGFEFGRFFSMVPCALGACGASTLDVCAVIFAFIGAAFAMGFFWRRFDDHKHPGWRN